MERSNPPMNQTTKRKEEFKRDTVRYYEYILGDYEGSLVQLENAVEKSINFGIQSTLQEVLSMIPEVKQGRFSDSHVDGQIYFRSQLIASITSKLHKEE